MYKKQLNRDSKHWNTVCRLISCTCALPVKQVYVPLLFALFAQREVPHLKFTYGSPLIKLEAKLDLPLVVTNTSLRET
jgi:hypothetical protein